MRYLLSLFLVLSYFFFPRYVFSFEYEFFPIEHYLYPFSHVNIYHLLVNVICLCCLRCPLYFFLSYFCCVISSFLPTFCEGTCGFSGYLFAMVGISWGKVGRFRDMLYRNKWFLFIPIFIPGVNGLLHIYCLLSGYFVGRCVKY